VSRTNIEIDDALVRRVMERCRLPSRRAAALRRLEREPLSREEALALARCTELPVAAQRSPSHLSERREQLAP
jgi:Arc/MetJ family transcription regulator